MTFKRIPKGSWCPECGPDVMVDEDGLCAACGSTCTGDGADAALKALSRQKTPAEAAVLRAALLWQNPSKNKSVIPPFQQLANAVVKLLLERKRRKT